VHLHFDPCPSSKVTVALHPSLSLCALLTSDDLTRSLQQWVKGAAATKIDEQYDLKLFSRVGEFLVFIQQERQHVDCLILENAPNLSNLLIQLREQPVLLPAVILVHMGASDQNVLGQATGEDLIAASSTVAESNQLVLDAYHRATLSLPSHRLGQLDQTIHQAIRKFLSLAAIDQILACDLETESIAALTTQNLLLQQRRLSEKLKERLGYLGVYYKRDPKNFLRYMSQLQRQELLKELKTEYQEIILIYFSNEPGLNEKIDNFVNIAFFADVAVAQIVEIHMGLMDEFSKQLKLEGRSDEILLDYRLTLIDVIAHLCEMYRRSIPRES
jgi:circadian clock protein KaiA